MSIKDILSKFYLCEKNLSVNVFVWDTIKHAASNKGVVSNIRLIGIRGVGVRFEGIDYDTWFYENSGTDRRSRYMDELSFFAHKEQEWLNKMDFQQSWVVIDKYFKKGDRSYADIQESPEDCKVIYERFYKDFPVSEKIKNVSNLIVGQTLVYTGSPRGTGMHVPEIGKRWELITEEDLISASIEIIERGRGWEIITLSPKLS